MKEITYNHAGVIWHFEEREGKLYLVSVEIFSKLFEFPNGGIAAKDSITSEEIADGSVQMEDLSEEVKAQMGSETIGEDAAHSLVADIIAQQEGKKE